MAPIFSVFVRSRNFDCEIPTKFAIKELCVLRRKKKFCGRLRMILINFVLFQELIRWSIRLNMSFKSKVVLKLGFKCKCCEKYFESKNYLSGHLVTKHRKYPCYKCVEACEDIDSLVKHLSKCQEGNQDVVPCGRVNLDEFSRENQVRKKNLDSIASNPIKVSNACSHFEKNFKRKHLLKKHFQSEHN